MKKFEIAKGTTFEQIMVPTMDTARNAYVLKMLIEHNKNAMLVGDTGTGKTLSIKQLLDEAGLGSELGVD